MNNKNSKTLKMVFSKPVTSKMKWDEIESLLENIGARIQEGNGSRVRIALNGIRAVFHRPHPAKEVNRGTILSLRKFLENAKVKP